MPRRGRSLDRYIKTPSLDTKVKKLETSIERYQSLLSNRSNSTSAEKVAEWQNRLRQHEKDLVSIQNFRKIEPQSHERTSASYTPSRVSKGRSATSQSTTPIRAPTTQEEHPISGWTAPLISPNTRALPSESFPGKGSRRRVRLGQELSPSRSAPKNASDNALNIPKLEVSTYDEDQLSEEEITVPANRFAAPEMSSTTSEPSSPSSSRSADSGAHSTEESYSASHNTGSTLPSGVRRAASDRLKRSLGEAFRNLGDVEESHSKSRRTSPNLHVSEPHTPVSSDDEAPYFEPPPISDERYHLATADIEDICARDEEYARKLAADFDLEQDTSDAATSQRDLELMLELRKHQEAMDEKYARELQQQFDPIPSSIASSMSSQQIHNNMIKSRPSPSPSSSQDTVSRKQQQFSNFGFQRSPSSSQTRLSHPSKSRPLGSYSKGPPELPKVNTDPDRSFSSYGNNDPLQSHHTHTNHEALSSIKTERTRPINFDLNAARRRRNDVFQMPDGAEIVDLSEDVPQPRHPLRQSNIIHTPLPGLGRNEVSFGVPTAPFDLYGRPMGPSASQLGGQQSSPRMPLLSLAYPRPAEFTDNSRERNAMAAESRYGRYDSDSASEWAHTPVPGALYIPGAARLASTQPYTTATYGQRMPGAFPGSSYSPFASSGQHTPLIQPDRSVRFSGDAIFHQANAELAYRQSMSADHTAYYDYITNDPTKSKEEIQELLDNIADDGDIPPEDREGTPDAMTYPLMEHQKVGLSWMKRLEEGGPKGGILADDMGLGKTIQALALMVSNISEDSSKKTNLIVAPVALLSQWQREINQKLKADHGLSSFILHGQKKADLNIARLKQYDVVLTTYGTLSSELRSRDRWQDRLKLNPHLDLSMGPKLLLLHERAYWYRVICDEAQCIKNVATMASKGACALKADFRWCLSGTPMQNNLLELQALIKFCRIKPFNDRQKFVSEISTPVTKSYSQEHKSAAMLKLQALIKSILLRRNKKTLIDGKPIVSLHDRVIEVQHSVFSEDERAFYVAMETNAQLQINKYIAAGTVGKNYSNALVLLLRLRQACCHPFLTRDFSQSGLGTTPNGVLDHMVQVAKELDPEVVDRILQEIPNGFECPICYDASENPRIIAPCGHDTCSECLSRLIDNVSAMNIAEGTPENSGRAKCPECRAQLTNAVTDLASFKKVHMPELEDAENASGVGASADAVIDDSDDSSNDDTSEESDSGDSDLDDFIVSDGHDSDDNNNDDDDDGDRSTVADDESILEFDITRELAKKRGSASKVNADNESSDDDEEDSKTPSKSRSKGKDKSKDEAKSSQAARSKRKARASISNKHKPEDKAKGKGKGRRRAKKDRKKERKTLGELKAESSRNMESKRKYMKYLRKTWESSGKIDKCMEILNGIRDADITEKTIIFSQWTSLLDLLEVPISQEKWRFQRYDGSMSAGSRNEAVLRFMDDPRCNVMLISLKAGNSGLNLTSASQVIILDPFWNPYIEEQAIDRAHRIGQQRTVTVHRLYVQNTVEDRILDLQEKKRELIDGALDEKASQSIGRLGVRELASLFGISDNQLPSNAR